MVEVLLARVHTKVALMLVLVVDTERPAEAPSMGVEEDMVLVDTTLTEDRSL